MPSSLSIAERIVRRFVAHRVFQRYVTAKEWSTQDALDTYLKEHPKANRTKHWVKQSPEERKPEPKEEPKEEPKSEPEPEDVDEPDEDYEYITELLEGVKDTIHDVFGKSMNASAIKRLYGGKAALPAGYAVDLQHVKDIGGRLHVWANVKYKNMRCGHITRTYRREKGSLVVHHDEFFLDKKHQGSGVGKAVFNAQIDEYEKVGVSKVKLKAAEVGKYVWSKAGFEWTHQEQFDGLKDDFETYLTEDANVDEGAAKEILSHVQTGEDLSHVMIDGKRVGKDFLIGLTEDQVYQHGGLDYIEMAQAPGKIKRL